MGQKKYFMGGLQANEDHVSPAFSYVNKKNTDNREDFLHTVVEMSNPYQKSGKRKGYSHRKHENSLTMERPHVTLLPETSSSRTTRMWLYFALEEKYG